MRFRLTPTFGRLYPSPALPETSMDTRTGLPTVTADKTNATILTPDLIAPGMHLNAGRQSTARGMRRGRENPSLQARNLWNGAARGCHRPGPAS